MAMPLCKILYYYKLKEVLRESEALDAVRKKAKAANVPDGAPPASMYTEASRWSLHGSQTNNLTNEVSLAPGSDNLPGTTAYPLLPIRHGVSDVMLGQDMSVKSHYQALRTCTPGEIILKEYPELLRRLQRTTPVQEAPATPPEHTFRIPDVPPKRKKNIHIRDPSKRQIKPVKRYESPLPPRSTYRRGSTTHTVTSSSGKYLMSKNNDNLSGTFLGEECEPLLSANFEKFSFDVDMLHRNELHPPLDLEILPAPTQRENYVAQEYTATKSAHSSLNHADFGDAPYIFNSAQLLSMKMPDDELIKLCVQDCLEDYPDDRIIYGFSDSDD